MRDPNSTDSKMKIYEIEWQLLIPVFEIKKAKKVDMKNSSNRQVMFEAIFYYFIFRYVLIIDDC